MRNVAHTDEDVEKNEECINKDNKDVYINKIINNVYNWRKSTFEEFILYFDSVDKSNNRCSH